MLISKIGQGQGFLGDYTTPKKSAVEYGFFLDAPWGSIPDSRRGSIMVEALCPRGGLLGGSGGTPGGRTSKLAALARARKEKAEAQKKLQQKDTGGEHNTAVSMLSRLSQKQPPPATSATPAVPATLDTLPTKVPESPVARSPTLSPALIPDKPSQSLDQSTREEPEEQPAPNKKRKKSALTLDLRAGPSEFALSMFGDRIASLYEIEVADSRMFSLPGAPPNSQASAFAGPSPDDVVEAAQGSSKGSESSVLRVS